MFPCLWAHFSLCTVSWVSQAFQFIICCLAWGSTGPSYQHLLPETPADSHVTAQDRGVNYTQATSGFTLAAALSAFRSGGNEQHLPSGFRKRSNKGGGGGRSRLTHYPWAAMEQRCPWLFFFMWLLNYPSATSQCQMFEETIIADRAEKEAKRRKLERDALELKSILKVKGNETEAVLLHQQLGVNYLHHRLRSGRKWPEKVGWYGVAQARDRLKLSPSTGADTKPAAGCRMIKKGTTGEKPASSNDLGLCPSRQPHCMGDTRGESRGCSPTPPLALSLYTDAFSVISRGPAAAAWAGGFPLQLGSAGETLCPFYCTRISPATDFP